MTFAACDLFLFAGILIYKMAMRQHISNSEELPADAYMDQYTTPGQVWQGPPDPIDESSSASNSVSGWQRIAPHFSWWFAMADVKLVDILFTFVVNLLGLEGVGPVSAA